MEEAKKIFDRDRIMWTDDKEKRIQEIMDALARLYLGKIKRFTVQRHGPIQEK